VPNTYQVEGINERLDNPDTDEPFTASMTAHTPARVVTHEPSARVVFTSAYRQLTPMERRFVDAHVQTAQAVADKEHVRLSVILQRPIALDPDNYLARPMVIAAITELVNEIVAASELSPDRIIREYIAIAFSNHADYLEFDDDGNPSYNLERCTPEQLSAVKKIQFEQSTLGAQRLTFETYDKMKALEILARYVGLVEADNQHWREARAAPILDAGVTVAQAGDAYAALLGA